MRYNELIEGRLLDKPTATPAELAKKHGVELSYINKQLARGIKVELEHTSKHDVAREIALDHLGEEPDYYEKLATIEETDDDADLFGIQPTGRNLPAGHKFIIYINNQPRGKAVDLEHAVDRAERYLAAVEEQNPDARVNIQIVDDHDGEVMWSGGSWTGGSHDLVGGLHR